MLAGLDPAGAGGHAVTTIATSVASRRCRISLPPSRRLDGPMPSQAIGRVGTGRRGKAMCCPPLRHMPTSSIVSGAPSPAG
eukprot:scaffold116175_cov28-Tisochrysis_lutea.AAC.2